jgi:hypothetical protein
MGFHQVLFTIQEITNGYALGVDNFNVTRKIPIQVQRAKGAAPLPGEQWVITKDLGPWTFAAIMDNPTEEAGVTIEIAPRVSGQAVNDFPTGTTEAILYVDPDSGFTAGPGLVSGPFVAGGTGAGDSTQANDWGIGYAVLNLDSNNRFLSGAWEHIVSDPTGGAVPDPIANRGLEANAEVSGDASVVTGTTNDRTQAAATNTSNDHQVEVLGQTWLEAHYDLSGPYPNTGTAYYSRDIFAFGWGSSDQAEPFVSESFSFNEATDESAYSTAAWSVGAGYTGEPGTTGYVAASIDPYNGISWFVLGQYEDGVPADDDNFILGKPSVAMIMESNDAALFVNGQDTNSVPYTYAPSAGNWPAIYRGAVSGMPGSGSEPYSNMPCYPGSVYPDITEGSPGIWVVDIAEAPAFIGTGYLGITTGSPSTTPPAGSMMSDTDGSLWVYNSSGWNHIT